ncbi:unknown [Firmicutes bacterium CAG:449]|nr:unknown [Firmicutes bacterium CAG:449]
MFNKVLSSNCLKPFDINSSEENKVCNNFSKLFNPSLSGFGLTILQSYTPIKTSLIFSDNFLFSMKPFNPFANES